MADHANAVWETWRNAANTGDINAVAVNSSDHTLIHAGTGKNLYLMANGTSYVYVTQGLFNFIDGTNVTFGSTSGTQMGTAASQKFSFWGATPIVQPANTTDLRVVLTSTGLLASGGATPLDLNGGALTAGTATITSLREGLHAHSNTSTTETIDLANGTVHSATLDANCTFTFTGSAASVACSFTLILKQDGTGSRTATWPAAVKWAGGVAPTLSTAANAVDILVFTTIDNGTTWYGNAAGKAYA